MVFDGSAVVERREADWIVYPGDHWRNVYGSRMMTMMKMWIGFSSRWVVGRDPLHGSLFSPALLPPPRMIVVIFPHRHIRCLIWLPPRHCIHPSHSRSTRVVLLLLPSAWRTAGCLHALEDDGAMSVANSLRIAYKSWTALPCSVHSLTHPLKSRLH